jgi:hypothetical protein
MSPGTSILKSQARVRLGRTSLSVTALGLGTTAIGNMYEEVDVQQAVDVVHCAWLAGLRYFDTAPQYGRGLAEQRLGMGLTGYDRDEYVVATKVGRLLRADAPPNPDDFFEGEPYDKATPAVNTVSDSGHSIPTCASGGRMCAHGGEEPCRTSGEHQALRVADTRFVVGEAAGWGSDRPDGTGARIDVCLHDRRASALLGPAPAAQGG